MEIEVNRYTKKQDFRSRKAYAYHFIFKLRPNGKILKIAWKTSTLWMFQQYKQIGYMYITIQIQKFYSSLFEHSDETSNKQQKREEWRKDESNREARITRDSSCGRHESSEDMNICSYQVWKTVENRPFF
jgi:hypothetical protein